LDAYANPSTWTKSAMPATDDDALLPFALPSICQKKVTAAFDGGLISSDGGVLLLAGADKRLGLVDTLAAVIPDYRDQTQACPRA
jgi:Transposase DDE domain group 1